MLCSLYICSEMKCPTVGKLSAHSSVMTSNRCLKHQCSPLIFFHLISKQIGRHLKGSERFCLSLPIKCSLVMDWYLHFKATEMFFGLLGSLGQTCSWQTDVWQTVRPAHHDLRSHSLCRKDFSNFCVKYSRSWEYNRKQCDEGLSWRPCVKDLEFSTDKNMKRWTNLGQL